MDQMLKRVILIEFYPELEYLSYKNSGKIEKELELKTLTQSRLSLKIYKNIRSIKRKIIFSKKTINCYTPNLILIKKHSSTRSYKIGKRPTAYNTPELIIDNKLIYPRKIQISKELESIVEELIQLCK